MASGIRRTAILEKALIVNKVLLQNFSDFFTDEKKEEVENIIEIAKKEIKDRKNDNA